MKEKLKQFKKIQSEFEQELKAYCKDKSIPLDERWELFVESGMGEIGRWITKCKPMRKIIDHDKFYFEKYSTNRYANLLERLEDPEEYEYVGLKDGWQNELKEYALDNFEAGWVHDW